LISFCWESLLINESKGIHELKRWIWVKNWLGKMNNRSSNRSVSLCFNLQKIWWARFWVKSKRVKSNVLIIHLFVNSLIIVRVCASLQPDINMISSSVVTAWSVSLCPSKMSCWIWKQSSLNAGVIKHSILLWLTSWVWRPNWHAWSFVKSHWIVLVKSEFCRSVWYSGYSEAYFFGFFVN